jgi:hypothetical protein
VCPDASQSGTGVGFVDGDVEVMGYGVTVWL